jgi:hypothetical protein
MPAARNHMRGMGGLVLVAYAAASTNSASSLTIDKPTGTVDGDILVAFKGGNDAAGVTWTGASGWTERVDQAALPNIRVATKTASSEGASYTFTPSSTNAYGGIVLAFRGAAYDAIGSVVTRSGDGSLVVTGFTSAAGLSLLFVYVDDEPSPTISTPAGYTEIASWSDFASTMKVFQKNVAAGATGSATSTIGGATGDTAGGIQVGLKNA